MLPWFEPEITPAVARPGVRRRRLDPSDAAANVRAVVEAQMMALVRHSSWMGVRPDTLHVTGGAAVNLEILQVMADVSGARDSAGRGQERRGARRRAPRVARRCSGFRAGRCLGRHRLLVRPWLRVGTHLPSPGAPGNL